MGMILLDTNIVSYLLKGDTRAKSYEPHLHEQQLAISFMTVAELFQWAAVRNWGSDRVKKLEQTLLETYTILSFDINTCRLWGEVRAECRSEGRPISPQDAWIAATALQHNLPLVTHNPTDYEPLVDLELITAKK